ncbi:MAG: nicotinate-nucleotide adenylyltransferase [Pseudomonadota bacterium]
MASVAILGGTFDPIHHGHLRLAYEARDAAQLDQVALLPAGQPVHRGTPGATAVERRRMLGLATADDPMLRIDTRELERDGPSYTVDTLREIRRERPDDPVSLILGLDAFALLETWYQWQTLLELAHLLVANRPGAKLPENGPVREVYEANCIKTPQALRNQPSGAIFFLRAPLLDISSTQIRDNVLRERSIRYLVPESVREFIEKENIYRKPK